jgi:GGDEF domain-containing protein
MTWSLEPVPPELQMQRHPYAGRVRWRGLDVLVENPKGTVRHGDGWQTDMKAHYGEIAGTLGLDGEPVDVYLGPNPDAAQVYVVRQKMPGEKAVDELKVMVGFPTRDAALQAFRAHYDRSGFFHSVVSMPVEKFIEVISRFSAPGIMAKATVTVPAHVRQTPSGQVQVPAYTYERQGVAASVPAVHEAHKALPEQEQRRRYFTDRNTGLLNARGAEAQPHDAARPMTARFSAEGFKSLNDNFGHHVADGALRHMAHELAQHMPDGVKRGGDIEGDVRDQSHADAIAERMSRRIDPQGRVKVTATAVPRSDNHEETLGRLGLAHRDRKDARVAAGEIGHRLHPPKAFQAHENPAEAMKPLAEHLASAPHRPTATLSSHHAAAYQKVGADKAFDQGHLEDTGLLTDDGFARSHELHPDHHVASADLRGLQGINDAFGREAADEILKTFSTLVHKVGGGEIHAAHPHGDEYLAHHQDPQKLRQFFGALKAASDEVSFVMEKPDGFMVQTGLNFVHGIGKDLDEADRTDLARNKRAQGDVEPPRLFSREEAGKYLDGLRRAGHSIVRLGGGAGEEVPQAPQGAEKPVEPLAKGSRFVLRWMSLAEQLGLFGRKPAGPTEQVEVKAHIRKDAKSGKYVMVQRHTSHHGAAAMPKPNPHPEGSHEAMLFQMREDWFDDGRDLLATSHAALEKAAAEKVEKLYAENIGRGVVFTSKEAITAALHRAFKAEMEEQVATKLFLELEDAPGYRKTPVGRLMEGLWQGFNGDFMDRRLAAMGGNHGLNTVYASYGRSAGLAKMHEITARVYEDIGEHMGSPTEFLDYMNGLILEMQPQVGMERSAGARRMIEETRAIAKKGGPEWNGLWRCVKAEVHAQRDRQHAEAEVENSKLAIADAIKGDTFKGPGHDPEAYRGPDETDEITELSRQIVHQFARDFDLRHHRSAAIKVGGILRAHDYGMHEAPGVRGDHWGSVTETAYGKISNDVAIGVAVAGDDGWLRNPMKAMEPEAVETKSPAQLWEAKGAPRLRAAPTRSIEGRDRLARHDAPARSGGRDGEPAPLTTTDRRRRGAPAHGLHRVLVPARGRRAVHRLRVDAAKGQAGARGRQLHRAAPGASPHRSHRVVRLHGRDGARSLRWFRSGAL